jgi:pimeloyl-ACP methyl ester carboxylesterase
MTDLSHFTTPDGLRISYRDEGEGLPLIALPGLTRNHRDFDFLAPHLSGVRLVRPDYRGRGASDHADWQTYTVPHELGDVAALMDHLGIARAAFLGTSRGGLISMVMAASKPDAVIGVCLNDVGPVVNTDGLKAIDGYIGRKPFAKSLDEMARLRQKTARGFANVPEDRWREDVERSYVETEDGLDLRYDPALRESYLAAMAAETPDLWPFFDALADKPVALVHGANSDLLTDDTVDEMRKRRPDLRYARVPDRGHVPFLDEPEALETIRSWLDDCR